MDTDKLRSQVRAILNATLDLTTVTERDIRRRIAEQNPHLDVKAHKHALKDVIQSVFVAVVEERAKPVGDNGPTSGNDTDERANGGYGNGTDDSDSMDELEHTNRKRKKRTKNRGSEDILTDEEVAKDLQRQLNGSARQKKKSTTSAPRKPRKKQQNEDGSPSVPNPNNPFNQPLALSPQLAELLGATELPRPQVVKQIWSYIKANNLQDEGDRRFIKCDNKLAAILKSDRVHMFTMNKLITPHLSPLPEKSAPSAEVTNTT